MNDPNVHYLTPPVPTGAITFAPAGLMRDIGLFIYNQAPYPIVEVALAASIGLMAGIAGRTFQTPQPLAGLNIYTMVVAPTGKGKEAGADGIDALMNAVIAQVPTAAQFIGPSHFASEPALVRYIAERSPSFVSLIGESGKWLQRLSNPRGSQHDKDVGTALLKLYGRSRVGSTYRGSAYADTAKNVADINTPAVSLYAEGTPQTVFSAMTEDYVSDGLFPRFLIFESAGEWPDLNRNARPLPSSELVNKLGHLCTRVLHLMAQNQYIEVRIDENAAVTMDAFRVEIRRHAERAKDDVSRDLWSRSHLRAMKLASLCAAGINPDHPMIDHQIAAWAIGLEQAATNNIAAKFDRGETGDQSRNDNAQINAMREVMNEWLTRPWSELAGYGVGSERLHQMSLVPWSFLSSRLRNKPMFKNGPGGGTATIKRTVEALIANGEFHELSRQQKEIEVVFSGRLFAPSNEHPTVRQNGGYLLPKRK